jgi:hypothetical protein
VTSKIDIREDGRLLGRIHVSRGFYCVAARECEQLKHVRWGSFAAFMDDEGKTRRIHS